MEEIILENPTIKELVAILLTLDQNQKIIILDADTGWRIVKMHINEHLGKIELSGEYIEMEEN